MAKAPKRTAARVVFEGQLKHPSKRFGLNPPNQGGNRPVAPQGSGGGRGRPAGTPAPPASSQDNPPQKKP
jgi:hypothetical protein